MTYPLNKTIAAFGLLGLALTGTSRADVSGFGNFNVNGTATTTPSTLTLTTTTGQAGTGFESALQTFNQGFVSTFTFLATNEAGGGADGFTFILQNNPAGADALGGGGGGKGYAGMTNSVAIAGNNFNGSSIGTGVNGNQSGFIDTIPSGVDLGAPTPTDFTVTYNPANTGTEISVQATQGASTFSQTYNTGDLTAILGAPTAYVGFGGGTGGGGFLQEVSNFSYTSVPEPTTIVALAGATGLLLGLRRRRA